MHRVTLSFGSGSHDVVRLRGHEAVSTLFHIEVVCAPSAGGAAPAAGTSATLTLDDGLGHTRTVTGIATDVRARYNGAGEMALALTLQPLVHPLTLAQDCRAFQDQNVIGIVDAVLAGIPHRWEVTGSFPTKPYRVQYRERSWSFICRLLEEAGIYFWFDHAAGSMLVLSDDSQGAPALNGGAQIAVQTDRQLRQTQEAITALGGMGRVTAGRFTIRSYNPLHPELPIEGAAGGGAIEWYDAPGGGPQTSAECQHQAALASAAAQGGNGICGQASSVRLVPGRILAAEGHAGLDGRYFLTQVSYRVDPLEPADGGGTGVFSSSFSAVPQANTFVAARNAPEPVHAGMHTAWVVGPAGEEIYNDEYGRVRVQQHWDRLGGRDELAGCWQRVAQRGAAESLLTPRIGWNVLTFSEEGAGHAPALLNRLHDAEHPPAYSLPANKTRVTFKTATTPVDGSHNEIRFEDRKGAEQMLLEASRDMSIHVQRVSTEGVDRDVARRIGRDRQLLVADDHTETIGEALQVTVGGNDDIAVAGGSVHTIDSMLTIGVGGDRRLRCEDATLLADDSREMTVGSALIDCSLGDIAGTANRISLCVGGAYVKLAPQSIDDSCGGVSVQTIGGAKLEFCRGDYSLDVQRWCFETVGGIYSINAAGHYLDAASNKAHWSAGAVAKAKAPKLLIEAADKIEVSCGQSVLVLLPNSIELRGSQLELSDAKKVKMVTPKIEHN